MSLLDIEHLRSVFKQFLASDNAPLNQAALSHKIELLEQFKEDLKAQRLNGLDVNSVDKNALIQHYQQMGDIQSHVDSVLSELQREYDFLGFLKVKINGLTSDDTLFLNNVKTMLLEHFVSIKQKQKVFIFCGALEKLNVLNPSESLKKEIVFLKTRFLTPKEREVSYEAAVEEFLSTVETEEAVLNAASLKPELPLKSPVSEELLGVRQRFFRN